jgi:DNA-binding transcriptional regulator GbsR (MarR family)
MNNIKITTANTHVRNLILKNAISLEILGEQRHLLEIEKKITNLHISNALKKEQYIIEMNIVLTQQLQEYTQERAQETEQIVAKINDLDNPTQDYIRLISQKNTCEENMHILYARFVDVSGKIPQSAEVTNYIFGQKITDQPCSRQVTSLD